MCRWEVTLGFALRISEVRILDLLLSSLEIVYTVYSSFKFTCKSLNSLECLDWTRFPSPRSSPSSKYICKTRNLVGIFVRLCLKNVCRWHKLYEIEQQINEHVSSIKSFLLQTSHTPTAVTFHTL